MSDGCLREGWPRDRGLSTGYRVLAKHNRKTPQGRPVTSHPLFPAIVALWFGALFGLSSLAIRPGLLESLVLAAHIDRVIPAAAPPLGVTARLLLALAMAALGALLGAGIGGRLARPKAEVRPDQDELLPTQNPLKLRARDAHPDAPARRPISAHEEIGGAAPLLRGAPRSYTITDGDFEPSAAQAAEPAFELDGFASDEVVAEGAPLLAPITDEQQLLLLQPPATDEPASAAPSNGKLAYFGPSAVTELRDADLESLGMAALAERLGQAMMRRRGRVAAAIAASGPAEETGDEEFGDEEFGEAVIDQDSGYSLLLDLSRSGHTRPSEVRSQHAPVRAGDTAEPVVIFPGQAARAAAALASLPVLAGSPALSAPLPDGATNHAASELDPEETRRALRDALDSLQRMSGAA